MSYVDHGDGRIIVTCDMCQSANVRSNDDALLSEELRAGWWITPDMVWPRRPGIAFMCRVCGFDQLVRFKDFSAELAGYLIAYRDAMERGHPR